MRQLVVFPILLVLAVGLSACAPGLPDLVPHNPRPDLAADGGYCAFEGQGGSRVLTVSVRNIGIGIAPTSKTMVSFNVSRQGADGSWAMVWEDVSVETPAINQNATVTVDVPVPDPEGTFFLAGGHSFKIVVNSDNLVPETNPNNNTISVSCLD